MNRLHCASRARDWLSLNPVFLDTETTSLHGEVCDLAVIAHDGRVLLDTLIRPSEPITRDAFGVHGLTDELVASAPTMRDVWPQLRAIITERRTVIYNAAFDVARIGQSLRACGIDSEEWQRYAHECAMLLYAEFYGQWKRGGRGYLWQALGAAAFQCRINTDDLQAHRARSDAELCRRLVLHMAAYQAMEVET